MKKDIKLPILGVTLCSTCATGILELAESFKKESGLRRKDGTIRTDACAAKYNADTKKMKKMGVKYGAPVFLCETCVLGIDVLATVTRPMYMAIVADLKKQARLKKR